mgnify:CR=1 FL=1
MALTGSVFMNQAIMVKSSEHEKNLAWVSVQQVQREPRARACVCGGGGGGEWQRAAQQIRQESFRIACVILRTPPPHASSCPALPLPQEAQQQAKQSQLKAATLLSQAGGDNPVPVGPCKLYVANLNQVCACARGTWRWRPA